jgi:hypothetical protein
MIKKIISGLTALIVSATVFSANVFAADVSVFSFDNDNSLSFWSTEGDAAIKDTGFKLSISNSEAYEGAGSLAVSEDMTKEAENIGGGAYFTASSIEQTTFAGSTITAMVYPVKDAFEFGAQITLYSDGEVYIPVSPQDLKANTWNEIQLKIPDNCNNTKIGFNIPLNRIYNGVVFYVDDIRITNSDGSYITNIGDSEEPVAETFASLSAFERILMISGLAVIVGAVIIFIIVALLKSRKKYR